jgi:hypothetical protein
MLRAEFGTFSLFETVPATLALSYTSGSEPNVTGSIECLSWCRPLQHWCGKKLGRLSVRWRLWPTVTGAPLDPCVRPDELALPRSQGDASFDRDEPRSSGLQIVP